MVKKAVIGVVVLPLLSILVFASGCSQIEENSAQLSVLQKDLATLQKRYDSLTTALSNSNAVLLSLSEQLLTISATDVQQNKAIDSLRNQVKEILVSLSGLNAASAEINTKIATLVSSLNTLGQSVDAVKAELADLQLKLTAVTNSYNELLRQLTCLLNELSIPPSLYNGLKTWYNFSGDALDRSGNANDGIVVGATLGKDRFGIPQSAYDFSGSGQYIYSKNQIPITRDLSISCWFYPRSAGSANGLYAAPLVTNNRDQLSNSGYNINYWNGVQGVYAQVGWSGDTLRTSLLPKNPRNANLNAWNHVMLIYQSGTAKLYLNGQLTFTKSGLQAIAQNREVISIGKEFWGPVFYNGLIDDIRIYDRALNNSEINYLLTH